MSIEENKEVVSTKSQVKPELWNPNAAANWSLVFTPILGAWLQAKNWTNLDEPEEAKKSMYWVYAGFVFLVVILFLPDDVGAAPGYIYVLAWYFTSGKKQAKYLKEKHIDYKKKSWGKPLLFGFIGVVLYVIFGMMIVDGGSDVDCVKEATMNGYKSLTVGEAFDNCSAFKSTSWESFETQNGRRVVEFKGQMIIPDVPHLKGTKDAVLTVQFLINKDDSFEVQAVGIEAVENGKKTTMNMSYMADKIIAKIYNNEKLLK